MKLDYKHNTFNQTTRIRKVTCGARKCKTADSKGYTGICYAIVNITVDNYMNIIGIPRSPGTGNMQTSN